MAEFDKGILELCNHADAEVARLLLLSLTEALLERKALNAEDIAGALLRTEYRSKTLDEIRSEEGSIIVPLEGQARLATDEWQTAFGLAPELYTLRKQRHEYQKAGQQGRDPWYADQVIALYAVSDEDG